VGLGGPGVGRWVGVDGSSRTESWAGARPTTTSPTHTPTYAARLTAIAEKY